MSSQPGQLAALRGQIAAASMASESHNSDDDENVGSQTANTADLQPAEVAGEDEGQPAMDEESGESRVTETGENSGVQIGRANSNPGFARAAALSKNIPYTMDGTATLTTATT